MKAWKLLLSIIAIFATLTANLAAQDTTAQVKKAQHHHYKLIDMGTLGGPNSSLPLVFFEVGGTPATAQAIASGGVVTGNADTSIPDPLCFFDDCLYPHAFRWEKGVTTDLGALPNAQWSNSNWISGNGLIAGISENGEIDPLLGSPEGRAVLWDNIGIADLGTLPGGYESFAFGANNRGQVTGSATNGIPDPYSYYYFTISLITNGTQTRAFLWDKHNGMQDLGTLGGPDAWAAFVNEQGQVSGISFTSFTPNANNGPSCAANVPGQDPFFWDSRSGMIDIGSFGGTCGAPQAINNRGQVVGGSYLVGNGAFHPFLWDRRHNPRLMDLGTFGGDNGLATWINESEQIVGSADLPGDQIHHAALWYHGVITDLGTVGTDPCSRGIALNAKGQVVGGSTSCLAFLHAFIWEDGGPMVDLNTLVDSGTDLTLTEALFINDAGEIAGNGVLPNGNAHAFVLIPCDDAHPEIEGCDYSMIDADTSPDVNSSRVKQLPGGQVHPQSGIVLAPMLRSFHGRLVLWNREIGAATPPSNSP